MKFDVQFAEGVDRICDILSGVINDEFIIPDTAAPFLSLRRIGPQIFQFKLPLLLQHQPEHFAMIHYSDMEWTNYVIHGCHQKRN
jgi:hypothetical protein